MKSTTLFISAVLSFALAGCQSTPEMTSDLDPETGLNLMESSTFDKLALEKPAKFGKYRAIYVAPLDLSTLTIDSRRLDNPVREWTLSDTERSKIIGYFADSVITVFKDSSLPLARGPGEHVLVAEFSLDSFTPSAPKDDIAGRPVHSEVFTYNVGDLQMSGWLRDSMTGQTLGAIEDTEEVGDSVYLQRNDRVNNIRKLKHTFNKWTRGLADALAAVDAK